MPVETNRKRSVRRIYAPGTKKGDKDAVFIPLKITDEITFKEERGGQEWVLTFDNTGNSSREVHAVYVGKDQTTGKDFPKDQQIQVERIDNMETKESSGGLEAIWAFLGNKENPPVHLETYKTKIYLSDENGKITDKNVWIEVQRIKSIEFTDKKDEITGQEYVWSLTNPDQENDQDDYTDVKDAVTKWDFTDINPPYRIDPFQEIVDCSFGGCALILYGSNKIAAISMSDFVNRKFTPTYKKTLNESNWNVFLISNQIKISKSASFILSTIKIESGKVVFDPESNHLYLTTNKFEAFSEAGNWPQMNGNGSVVYTSTDKFQFEDSTGKITRVGPNDTGDENPTWIGDDGTCFYEGGAYSQLKSSVSGDGAFLPPNPENKSHVEGVWRKTRKDGEETLEGSWVWVNNPGLDQWFILPDDSRDVLEPWSVSSSLTFKQSCITQGAGLDKISGANSLSVSVTSTGSIGHASYNTLVYSSPRWSTTLAGFSYYSSINRRISCSDFSASLSHSGTASKHSYTYQERKQYLEGKPVVGALDFESISMVGADSFSSEAGLGSRNITIEWGSQDYDALRDTTGTGDPSTAWYGQISGENRTDVKAGATGLSQADVYLFAFPYGYNGKPWKLISKYPVAGDYKLATYVLQTPYKTYEYDENSKIGFSARIHASNGKNVVQGYDTFPISNVNDVTNNIFLDGNDISKSLASGIGAAKGEIQLIFLDIPLSKIKTLK